MGAKRYNLRPMIDGDNVMDWPRDLRRGPCVVIATDYDALLARCEAAEARFALARHALTEIRLRLHAVGRRPEECYEMSLIDDVLAQEPPR